MEKEKKEKSKLKKMLTPQLSSFILLYLGINATKYHMDYDLKIMDEEYNKKSSKISSAALGIFHELLRDVPTGIFVCAGEIGTGIGYYALSSYFLERINAGWR
jgi:hypothetical protein